MRSMRQKTAIITVIILSLILPSCALAQESIISYDEQEAVVKIDDLKEVNVYVSTLEAENKQYRASLVSEREAAEQMIEANKKAMAEYSDLTELLKKHAGELSQENGKLKKKNKNKNIIIGIIAAAFVAAVVSK